MNNTRLEHLLLKEMAIIYKYLLKLGAGKEDAEDIVQDTLYKAVRYGDALYEDKIFSWLFKVALNSYYNLCKRKNKKQVIVLDAAAVSAMLAHDPPEHRLLSKELQENVRRVLDGMKESYTNLLVLKYITDLSYKEIANILGLDEHKVKVYLYRARNKFRELWEEAGYDK